MITYNYNYISKQELKKFLFQKGIGVDDSILLQIFTGVCRVDFIENLIDEIKSELPNVKIIGATTSGEIIDNSTTVFSTVLSFTLFEKTVVETYSQERVENSYEMAEALIGNFDSSKKAKVAISFCDGLHTNGELYLNAFHDYDKDLVVAGGLAGDNGEFIETIVFNEDGILTGGCVIALLYSDDLEVHTKANFGWENIGKKLTITKVKENRVYEIDGICAVDIYAKYLGSAVADDLPKVGVQFPLIILRDKLNIPRAVLGKNSDGSLNFVGNFKLGDIVTFGYGNISAVIESSSKSFNSVFKNPVESIFIYSCMARKALLGNSIDIELKALSNITSLSGFFTYGEFYSNCKTLNNELLNQTMTLLTLSESKNVKENVNSIEKYNHSKKSKTLQALSHLISQTTLELEEINSSLSVKVDDEVKKNRIKDQQILNQSRLAQMGEMMSMIAHQWRQPLSAISSTSASLELKAALNKLDNDIVNEHAKRISLYSQHLSETINDFRNFFKPVKEEVETNFTEIVNSVLKIVQVSLENKNIEVILDLKSEDRFKSYPNELKQVVLNLLKNAEDALLGNSTEKPLVKISTFREDENLILEVSDNGGGISQEIIEKIFDPYFSTRLEKNGTGLGLYMSKIIIEDHCHSKLIAFNRGDGAVFQIKTSVNSKGEL